MRITIYFFAVLLFVACGKKVAPPEPSEKEQNEKEQKNVVSTRTVVDPKNRQDTVFLGYILGQKTKSITKQLIKNGDLLSKRIERRTFTLSMGGFAQNIIAKGYPLDLYIGDKKYDALLSLYDTNGDLIEDDGMLMSLRIYIPGGALERADIITELKKQYGKPNTPPQGGYKVDVPQEVNAFWNISNKAVYLESFSGFMVLIYEDIIAVRNKNKAETAAKDSEKAKNRERSKKTHL
jgi:hypothetical protein